MLVNGSWLMVTFFFADFVQLGVLLVKGYLWLRVTIG